MNIEVGHKIIPISKKAGHRDFDSCATHYLRLERDQDHLFVVGIHSFDESLKENVFWCNVVPRLGGDLYAESDLKPYG